MTFDELVNEIDSGALNAEASALLRDLVERLNAHAQQNSKAKGELTLKIKFDATSNGRVEITGEATGKFPAPPRTRETRWIGPKGDLLAADPRQEALPLRTPGKKVTS